MVRVSDKLYSFGVPRLCGHHRSGRLSSIVQLAVTKNGVLVIVSFRAGIKPKDNSSDSISNSGMERIRDALAATTE